MSKELTIIDKVKALIFDESTDELSFVDANTADGVAIKISGESIEVGGVVTVLDAEGVESIATEGDYILEDGTTLKVDAEGLITEVMPVVEEEEVAAEEVEVVEASEEVVEANPLEAKILEIESKLNDILSKFESMTETVEAFSKLPGEVEIALAKKEVKITKNGDRLDFLSAGRK